MIKRITIIALLFVMLGCGHKEQKQTDIPLIKMKVVVWQLMQADEYFTRYSVTDSTLKKEKKNVQYYQQIFDLNKVDRVQFYKQMRYLETHPVEFKELIDSVNELSKREKTELIKH
jgi:ABC-type uncharacterized transport system auxiliary subunit